MATRGIATTEIGLLHETKKEFPSSGTAEQDKSKLHTLFIESEQWQDFIEDRVDIVLGTKGSGKSAIYEMTVKKPDSLSNIVVLQKDDDHIRFWQQASTKAGGEIEKLIANPNQLFLEQEIASSWKYLCVVQMASFLSQEKKPLKEIKNALEEVKKQGIAPNTEHREIVESLVAVLASALAAGSGFGSLGDSVKKAVQELSKIFLSPKKKQSEIDFAEIFKKMDVAFQAISKKCWCLYDRLDAVQVFRDSPKLESLMMRGLLKAALEINKYEFVRLKLFLRSDLIVSISGERPFPEMTHLRKSKPLSWSMDDLIKVFLRRLPSAVKKHFGQGSEEPSSPNEIVKAYYRFFPEKRGVEDHMSWLEKRLCDGGGTISVRDFLNFIHNAADLQLIQKESKDGLFDQTVIERALDALSKYKKDEVLEQEYPTLKKAFKAFEFGKATHSTKTLESLLKPHYPSDWNSIIDHLHHIGFLKKEGEEYTVPHLFRKAFSIKQGAKDI